ncbi:MAG: GtrA family protein [Bacilli bacterium]|jgi:putative flippase GtrA|nr:GtrA family protein [Bacilli bacterium]
MDNNENITEKKDEKTEQEKKPAFYKTELLVNGLAILLFSLAVGLISLIYKGPSDMRSLVLSAQSTLNYDFNLIPYALIFSLVDGFLLTGLNLLFPYKEEKAQVKSLRNWIVYTVLFLLGLLAYFVMAFGLMAFSLSAPVSFGLANLIFSIYIFLMIKLYFFQAIEDKGKFWEIVRFALVGVIASLFDFTTCYLFEFKILPQSWVPIALTIVSVTMGFIVGVTINYLCSVYMVFKATTEKSIGKTGKGKFLFVFLGAVGLFMGYGLQWFFFDLLKVGYVVTFIIRTLIVLVWNYLSRKAWIFK